MRSILAAILLLAGLTSLPALADEPAVEQLKTQAQDAAGKRDSSKGALTDAEVAVFFLSCVIVAGVFGAVTLKPTTLLIQTVPAILALAATLSARVP